MIAPTCLPLPASSGYWKRASPDTPPSTPSAAKNPKPCERARDSDDRWHGSGQTHGSPEKIELATLSHTGLTGPRRRSGHGISPTSLGGQTTAPANARKGCALEAMWARGHFFPLIFPAFFSDSRSIEQKLNKLVDTKTLSLYCKTQSLRNTPNEEPCREQVCPCLTWVKDSY